MKILAVTGLASIQDLGRFGHRSHGIGVNGAMDSWALQAGNALLNNPLDTAAIELTLGGMTIEFEENVTFCVTGALFDMSLDGEKIPNGWRMNAKTGQTLTITRAVQGMHGYLCVQGGFDLPSVLDSVSTNLKAEFGGLHGRLLAVGDILKLKQPQPSPSLVVGIPPVTYQHHQKPNDITVIRVLPNSEFGAFTTESQQAFVQQPWKLSSSSNRMGYRLEGEALGLREPLQMQSHGVDVGMIQVPPQGQPIVLMADTQTTGGYPKIATVIAADIGLLAQLRFGQTCQFQWVTLAEAMSALAERHRYITRIQEYGNDKNSNEN